MMAGNNTHMARPIHCMIKQTMEALKMVGIWICGGVNGPFLERREDIGARQRDGGGAERLEYLGDHTAGPTG